MHSKLQYCIHVYTMIVAVFSGLIASMAFMLVLLYNMIGATEQQIAYAVSTIFTGAISAMLHGVISGLTHESAKDGQSRSSTN